MREQGTERAADGLMLAVAGGDRAALARLFEAEAGRLIAVARRIVRRPDLAEEIVQESFVAAWRGAAGFDPARGPARVWLTTIVRNKALNALRDGARVDYLDGDALAEIGDRMADADQALRRLDERDELRRCLERLEAPKRQAILLAYVTGLNHGEVAATLGAPLGTVKAWIRRGSIALQECLS